MNTDENELEKKEPLVEGSELNFRLPADLVERIKKQQGGDENASADTLVEQAKAEARRRVRTIELLTECAKGYEDDDPSQPTFNAHVCKACGFALWTVHVHKGTAPAMVQCPACQGNAWSVFYRVRREIMPEGEPMFEWYRPTLKSMQQEDSSPEYLNHIVNGGLMMRPRSNLPMLTHGGEFVSDAGIIQSSPSNERSEKELASLQAAYEERQKEKRQTADMARQQKDKRKAEARRKRKQRRKSQQRNRRK